ncbi:MAG: hypothetical protein ACLSDQ_07550 [Adlercreutzia equolifaciens]
MAEARYRGEVVKLDRGYPLVRLEDGELLRCEHATALVKGERRRAVIGDVVEVAVPPAHDKGSSRPFCPARVRSCARIPPSAPCPRCSPPTSSGSSWPSPWAR